MDMLSKYSIVCFCFFLRVGVFNFCVCEEINCAKNRTEVPRDSGSKRCHAEARNPVRSDPNGRMKQITISSATDSQLECCLKGLGRHILDDHTEIIVDRSNLSLSTFVKEIEKLTDEHFTQIIIIEHSRIKEVPKDSFGLFRDVRKIALSGNQISSLVSESFYDLTNLLKIDLSNNEITRLPKRTFSRLPDLMKIDLSWNNIITVEPDAFHHLVGLKTLDLRGNYITAIDFTMFRHSEPLIKVNLTYNNLTSINDDVQHICQVRELYLGHNHLTYISPNITCMRKLDLLHLNHNNLTTLSSDLKILYEHSTPNIDHNPWFCDCKIEWLINLVQKSLITDQVTCSFPVNMTMRSFNESEVPCIPLPQFSEEQNLTSSLTYIIVFSAFGGFSILLVISAVVCLWRRKRKSHLPPVSMGSPTITPVVQSPCGMVPNTNYSRLYSNSSSISTASSYVNNAVLKVGKLLGSGAFGEVYEGYSGDVEDGNKKVAIKMIRENSSSQEYAALEQEFKQLTQIDKHPYIIQVFSTGKIDGSFVMVMEIAEHGDLLTHLRRLYEKEEHVINSLDSSEEKYYFLHDHPRLISFMWNVAKGMEYLSHLKIIHRDLAARNILLCSGPVAKIADFGLSRDVYESGYYYQDVQGRLPYKWLSPETLLNGKSTLKSDVWSFGILAWEVVTLGSNPYPGIPPVILMDMYKNGYVMPQPSLCPNGIYAIMRRCWEHYPDSRPDFTDVMEMLDDFLQTGPNKEYIAIENEVDETFRLMAGVD